MKKITSLKLLFITYYLIASCCLSAQVTIGSDNKPIKGALLELTEGAVTTKGLGLPRVKLTNLKPTTDAELAQSIGNVTGSFNRSEHIGLVIYNSNDDPTGCVTGKNTYQHPPAQGLYVWDGDEWQQLPNLPKAQEDVRTIIDHGTSVVDGVPVGRFTMSYNDGINSAENETYYYADYGIAGTWMTQNLRTQYSPNGTKLAMTGVQNPDGKDTSGNPQKVGAYPSRTNPADATDYNANRADGKEIGLQYDWYTATDHHNCMLSVANQSQVGYLSDNPATPGVNEVESIEVTGYIKGICPTGWHVPSDREWNRLEKYFTENASLYTQTPIIPNGSWTNSWETENTYRGTIDRIIKSKTAVNNNPSPVLNASSKTALNGGFDGILVGSINSYGSGGGFWTSGSRTIPPRNEAMCRIMGSYVSGVARFSIAPHNFLSVRCKKN